MPSPPIAAYRRGWAAAVGGEKVSLCFHRAGSKRIESLVPPTRQWSADTDERGLQSPQTVAGVYFFISDFFDADFFDAGASLGKFWF
jgi:hypothetical protein